MKYLKAFVDSVFFPLILGLLAFIGWVLTNNIFSAVIMSVLAFCPLFGKDGRGYLSLIIMAPLMVFTHLSFNNIDIGLVIFASSIILSLIIFMFIYHPRFRLGRAALTLIPLYSMFAISLIIQFATDVPIHNESLSFLIGFAVILIIYIILVPTLFKDGVFIYFSQTLIILASIISLQVIVHYGRIGYSNVGNVIDLGWIQSSTMASSILVITLPFVSLFLRKKQWRYIPSMLLIFFAIYQLRTVSGLICTILVFVPLVFMTFHHYKYYPYYIIASFVGFGGLILTLFLLNDNFFSSMISSLRYLSQFLQGNIPAHQIGIQSFMGNPVFGPSINILAGVFEVETGYIRLLDNTVVTTLVMGGSFGLIVYAAHLVNMYSLNFQRKNLYCWFFFIFLICTELIGLVDNTIYNLFFNIIYLLIIASYESTNRAPDVIIEENFFKGYIQKKKI